MSSGTTGDVDELGGDRDGMHRDHPLVIIPCGQRKVWDADPEHGPAPACDAYTGGPFKVNRAYAKAITLRWIILSAKYGFIPPDFSIPGPYDVTFKKPATGPVQPATLIGQVRDQRLDQHPKIIALGGREYRAVITAAFTPFGTSVEFPFAGLSIGRAMRAIKRATPCSGSVSKARPA